MQMYFNLISMTTYDKEHNVCFGPIFGVKFKTIGGFWEPKKHTFGCMHPSCGSC